MCKVRKEGSMKKWLKKLIAAWMNSKTTKATPQVTPQVTPPVTTSPTVPPAAPVVLNDDPSCDLVIKCDDKEPDNEGQVTYIKRFLTCAPFKGCNCVCVQFNDASVADGERLVFKDQSRTGVWSGMLPSDIPISKVVVWYE